MGRLLFAASVALLVLAGCSESSKVGAGAPKGPGQAASASQKLSQEGTAIMTDQARQPSDKYPKALEKYREALKLDPENEEARQNKAMIEGIYKQMGRPIPGEK